MKQTQFEKNDTWDLVQLTLGKEVIGTRWVYKTKYKYDGSIDNHKARLVAKGYTQQEGVDYTETFAPATRMNTIKLVLALATQQSWIVYQMNWKSSFLNRFIDEEVYVSKSLQSWIVYQMNVKSSFLNGFIDEELYVS